MNLQQSRTSRLLQWLQASYLVGRSALIDVEVVVFSRVPWIGKYSTILSDYSDSNLVC